MAERGCAWERELLEAIGAGRWAESRDEKLNAHVAGCAECFEVAAVAAALLEDRLAEMRGAPVPRSGVVWWRMQLRARRDEEFTAARTVSVAHAAVLVAASGISLVTLGATFLADSGSWLSNVASAFRAQAVGASSLPLLLAGAAWLVLAPLAVWLAVTEE